MIPKKYFTILEKELNKNVSVPPEGKTLEDRMVILLMMQLILFLKKWL